MKIEITPVIVITDMSPLIHLAAAGHLPLLQEFGRVMVMDVVAYEASNDLTKPWARDVAEWLAKGQEPASNQPVEIVKTEIGEAYRLARQADPTFKIRDAGDRAIRDWLVDTLPEIGGPALVVYEDKKVPKLIQREHLEEVVVVATTRSLLAFAEERGLIESAEDAWNSIIERAGGGESRPQRPSGALDVQALSVLRRYSAGEISARQAAKEMGPRASEHDVFAGIVSAHLSLPAPSPDEIAREIGALRALYGPHGPRP